MNNSWQHLAVPSVILRIRNIISKNYLEDDVIIVQNINAQRPWGEEWQSLDQSLRLEENPTSLARKNSILFGRRFPTCSWQVALFQQTTRNTFMTLKHVQKVFSFVQTEDPLARYWGPMQLLWQEIQFLFHLKLTSSDSESETLSWAWRACDQEVSGQKTKNTFARLCPTFKLDFIFFLKLLQ